MARDVYGYVFSRESDPREVREALALAIAAVESLHGEARIRLDARYVCSGDVRTVVVDASTPVGQVLNQLFVGYARRELGPGAFRVDRVDRCPEPEQVGGPS